MNNQCEIIKDKIADYVLGNLSREETDALGKHISQCSRCREYTEFLQDERRLLLRFVKELDTQMNARQAKVIEALKEIPSEKTRQFSLWRAIIQSRITRYAAAAVIIASVLLGIKTFLGYEKKASPIIAERPVVTEQDEAEEIRTTSKPDISAAQQIAVELKEIEGMYAAGDIAGLVYMLAKGHEESKVAAANYLAKIGDLSAISALEELAEKWNGDTADNPFLAAASAIKDRLEEEKQETQVTEAAKDSTGTLITKEPKATAENMVTYKGKVVDAAGEPIQGVTIKREWFTAKLEYYQDEVSAVSNADGKCTIGPLKPISGEGGAGFLIFDHPQYGIGWWFIQRKYAPEGLTMKLFSPASIAGIVTDGQGYPVEGAVVQAEVKLKDYGSDLFLWDLNKKAVLTDSEGWFVIKRLPEQSKLHIDIAHKNYGRYSTKIGYEYSDEYPIDAGKQDLQFVLEPGGFIKGQLVMDGKPYERKGVVIIAENPEQKNLYSFTATDENGRFETIGLYAGNYNVMIYDEDGGLSKEGLMCKPLTNIEVLGTGEATEIELPLLSGIPVTIGVVEKETGEPIEDVVVSAKLADGTRVPSAYVRTDSNGECELHLSTGEYEILAQGWKNGGLHNFSKNLSVKADSKDLSLEIAIKSHPMIWGWLVDANDNPIEGTVILGYDRSVETYESGEFAIPEPWWSPGDIHIGYAFDKDKKLGRAFLWKSSDEPNDLHIVVEPLVTITGRIVDTEGVVFGGFLPKLDILLGDGRVFAAMSNTVYKISVGIDGRFEYTNVPIGLSMRVFADKPGYQGWEKLPELKPGDYVDVGDVVLKPLHGFEDGEADWTGILSGRVINEYNEPMMGLTIHTSIGLDTFEDVTDVEGHFELEGLPKGKRISGSVYAAGYGHTMFKTVVDGNDLDIQIFPQGWELLDRPAPGLFVERWLNTEPVTLEKYQGKVVLLQVGAYLPHYLKSFERIEEINKKYASKGLQVITIHQRLHIGWGGKVTEDDIRKFIKKHGVDFPFGIDEADVKVKHLAPTRLVGNGATYSVYGVKATPALYLIDKQGIVRISPTRDNLEQWIRRLLAE